MLKENCKLISEYKSCNEPVHYLFESMNYKITPARWNVFNDWKFYNVRPHLAGRKTYNRHQGKDASNN